MLSNEKKPRGLQGLSPSLIKIYSSAMDQLEQSRRKNKGGASSALVISKERPKLRKDKLVINDPILLHEQFIEVKKEQNTTKNENRVLKTRISVLEKEISKQNKAMEEIYTTQVKEMCTFFGIFKILSKRIINGNLIMAHLTEKTHKLITIW